MKPSRLLLAAVLLTTGFLNGCEGQNETVRELHPSSMVADHTLTMMVESHPTWMFSEEWPIWSFLREQTNVKLDIKAVAGSYADTLNMTIASGELPDLILMDRIAAGKFGQQGALVDLNRYADLMPNLRKRLRESPEVASFFAAGDGNLYLAPTIGIGETNRVTWMYREDVFRKHGIAAPRSFDELYGALKRLKELYPDSYPFTFRSGIGITSMIGPNFGTAGDAYYDFGERKWKYGPVEDKYRRMIEFLHRAYSEKLIPPNLFNMQTKHWQDQMSNGQSFVTFDAIGRIDSFNETLRRTEPAAKMAFMAPPEGNNLNQAVNTVGLTVASTSNKVKEALRYIDFFYSEDGRRLSSWGKEGVTHTVRNGVKTFMPEYATVTDLRQKTGLSTFGTYGWFDYDAHISLFTPELVQAHRDARAYDSPLQPIPAFDPKESESIGLLNGSINKYMTDSVAKFILGERSFDEWSQYVDDLYKLGLQSYQDLYNTAYDRSMRGKE